MQAVISLFDYTGEMVRPWITAGYQAFIFDMQHDDPDGRANPCKVGGLADTWDHDITWIFQEFDVCMLFSFPPCTDLAISGAKHFAAKAIANPNYLAEAMSLVYIGRDIGEAHRVPYMIENPVGVISNPKNWRKPDFIFNPCEYGGYLPEDDVSPHPGILPARDAYTKKTCLWTGNGFVMPERKPVEPVRFVGKHGLRFNPQTWLLGGKSLRTKNIRSMTPRGFAEAVYQANS